jgi:hypothetical protein
MKIDVHQHLWTEPFVSALATRREFPFVRRESGLAVLYLADERPYVIDLAGEAPDQRAGLVEEDGLDAAVLCISSPLGVEWLPRRESLALIDAYHEGALAAGGPFAAWGALPLACPDPDDVDRALARGCVGVSLPAGAVASVEGLDQLSYLLWQLEKRGAPLLVHPGPGPGEGGVRCPSLAEPLWWPAMTRYVASMQAAWLAFFGVGRARHPELRVVFAMLAGLAPLHVERLRARGGPDAGVLDRLTFYDTSSYGPGAVNAMAEVVGGDQLVYGSDRPVVDPHGLGMPALLDWDPIREGTARALGGPSGVIAR